VLLAERVWGWVNHDTLGGKCEHEGAGVNYEQKRHTIESLLDHWEDFVLPNVGGITKLSDGEGLGLVFASGMGRYPSVVELDRCLGVLRVKVPQHFKHLRGFYSSEWRVVEEATKIRSASGKMVDAVVRKRRRVVPGWVTWRLVDHGLDMVVALWDSGVVLELPPALNRRLRETMNPETGEPAWTEAA
jgi:hypothetical protein